MNGTLLESAADYANDWQARQFGHTINGLIAAVLSERAGVNLCTCNGGLPMMKRDCPKHGHLVRSTEKRAT